MNSLRRKEIYSNWPYIFWFLFYFTLLWFIFGANGKGLTIVTVAYAISFSIAVSPLAESLWRSVSGVRAIATNAEKKRLLPLFEEVYRDARRVDRRLSRNISLYIQEDMDINAFAFGRYTLILTKGSIELLNDEQLKGLIAHEFGHFSHYDTVVLLLAVVGNLLMSIVMRIIYVITKTLLFIVRNKDTTFTIIFRILHGIISGLYKAINFMGDVILMSVSREHEFMADAFAHRCGYGEALTDVYIRSIKYLSASREAL